MERLPSISEESGSAVNVNAFENLRSKEEYETYTRMKLFTVLAVVIAVVLAVACVILATQPPKK